MAATMSSKKITKQDEETIVEGQQITKQLDARGRLRSSSGKIYTTEITPLVEHSRSMACIEEVMANGGKPVDQLEEITSEKITPMADINVDGNDRGASPTQVSQLIELIQNLQTTVNDVNEKVSALTTSQVNTEARFVTIEKKQSQAVKELDSVKEILGSYQVKVDILTDIVIRQQQTISDLKGQMLDTQIRGMKNNILVAGIPEKVNENCIKEFHAFAVEQLQIKDKLIPVESAIRVGSGQSRAMLVTLRHNSDKGLIFDHVGNLKGKKVNGVQCFVSSHLPEEANEKRRKINTIMAENKKKPMARKLPISVKAGKLLYKGEPVGTKIQVPAPARLMKLSDSELEALNQIPMVQGGYEEQEESTFTAYATQVSCFQDVDMAYQRMRLSHGQAHHIACAYRMEKVPEMFREDGCDDGEFRAARVLLQSLREMQVNNVAVFMIRYYGGVKLGPKRFELMKKVAESAVRSWQVSLQEKNPTNEEEWRLRMQEDPPKQWGESEESQEEE